MASLIKRETGANVDLVEGARGEFAVWVGNQLIAQKDPNGFPSDEDVLAAVQRALTAK